MENLKSPEEMLELYYCDLRSHLLEAAAALDRIERAGLKEDTPAGVRLNRLLGAAAVLQENIPGRAERFLRALSD